MVDAGEHVGLAYGLASKYGRGVRDPEGVREVAVFALLGAARRFDPTRGEWAAFAAVTVSAAVRGEVGRQIREPATVPLTSVGEDGQEYERPDLPHVAPHDGERLLAETVRAAVASLPEREAEIVRLHFALDGGEPLSLETIGARLGLSPSRVGQLEARAMRTLRRALTRRRAW